MSLMEVRKEIEKELTDAIDQTGLTVDEILEFHEITVEDVFEAMDQTGLTVKELFESIA